MYVGCILLIHERRITMAKTLYERIGGDAALGAAVEILYSKIIADDRINGYFENVDIKKQGRKMKSFLSYAFGADTPFTGESLRTSHEKMVANGLSDIHFDAVKENIESTLKELNVTDDLIQEVITITESTRKDVLSR